MFLDSVSADGLVALKDDVEALTPHIFALMLEAVSGEDNHLAHELVGILELMGVLL